MQKQDDIFGKIFGAILEWHKQQRSKDIRAAFELGDLIVNAVIHTGLTEYKIIKRIMDGVGDMAYSVTTYNRAARLARVFTPNQRQVLTEKGVSLERAEILAGKEFNGKRRINIVNKIKTGTITDWATIRSSVETANLEKTATLRHGLLHSDDVIAIRVRDHGQFQRDLMFDGLRALVSQIPQDVLLNELNRAISACNKSGLGLRGFDLKAG